MYNYYIFELLQKLLPKPIHCEYDNLETNLARGFVLSESFPPPTMPSFLPF